MMVSGAAGCTLLKRRLRAPGWGAVGGLGYERIDVIDGLCW
jgi:hypothetical protein